MGFDVVFELGEGILGVEIGELVELCAGAGFGKGADDDAVDDRAHDLTLEDFIYNPGIASGLKRKAKGVFEFFAGTGGCFVVPDPKVTSFFENHVDAAGVDNVDVSHSECIFSVVFERVWFVC